MTLQHLFTVGWVLLAGCHKVQFVSGHDLCEAIRADDAECEEAGCFYVLCENLTCDALVPVTVSTLRRGDELCESESGTALQLATGTACTEYLEAGCVEPFLPH